MPVPSGFSRPQAPGGPIHPVPVPFIVPLSQVPPKASIAAAPNGIQDSNNDATAWSEHETEVDHRKYWFNKITQASTFEKPACLKTPEERSIAPCPWKEYSTADGRKYYSDGTETT